MKIDTRYEIQIALTCLPVNLFSRQLKAYLTL